jgi:hypothetical protein
LDDPNSGRNLRRSRNQRLSSGRILISNLPTRPRHAFGGMAATVAERPEKAPVSRPSAKLDAEVSGWPYADVADLDARQQARKRRSLDHRADRNGRCAAQSAQLTLSHFCEVRLRRASISSLSRFSAAACSPINFLFREPLREMI